jgi:cytochrome c biogenesis protein CcmG/thiol:disulfide interchange protein DsbE
VDLDGRVAIDFGVYGAPETYVIDQNGTIRLKHVGPILPDVWSEKILPVVQELNRQGGSK